MNTDDMKQIEHSRTHPTHGRHADGEDQSNPKLEGATSTSRRWLVLRLEGPLMAFGGIVVDHIGPIRDLPGTSMLTGLIGNAFGWHWSDRNSHQAIQDRLVFAARHDREGMRMTDMQNVQLAKNDKGWTTHGIPEGRDGGAKTYHAPHRRRRHYQVDLSVRIVLGLEPADESPTLEDLAVALDYPARPLFLGRKSCLPSTALLAKETTARWIESDTAYDALRKIPGQHRPLRAWWPLGEGPSKANNETDHHITEVADLRNWHTGLHAGARRIVEGQLTPEGSA